MTMAVKLSEEYMIYQGQELRKRNFPSAALSSSL
jgi:hypothetical protein